MLNKNDATKNENVHGLQIRDSGAYTATAPTILNRGFTFHEHIDEFNLINMNGRVYDPVLGRFKQPDNQVQYPSFLQTFNKYAYVFNNPLSYTDPSGWGGESGNDNWDGGHGLSPEYSNYRDLSSTISGGGIPWASLGGGGGGPGWYRGVGTAGARYNAWMAASNASIFQGQVHFNFRYPNTHARYSNHKNWATKTITINFSNSFSSDFGEYSFNLPTKSPSAFNGDLSNNASIGLGIGVRSVASTIGAEAVIGILYQSNKDFRN